MKSSPIRVGPLVVSILGGRERSAKEVAEAEDRRASVYWPGKPADPPPTAVGGVYISFLEPAGAGAPSRAVAITNDEE